MGRRVDSISQMQDEDEAEIDLTPMLDVVFIMLIFFIVTASFLREFGVDGMKPPSVQQTQTESKTIAVKISSTGVIEIDGLNVDPRAVSAHIIRRKAENPDAAIAVLAGQRAKAELVVGVIDAAREAGFRRNPIPISELQE
ncbi:MAG: biopolymer transporter ExbD [Gammaproteobacteria bacterium]|jgi:biopolymer transport protein ExbD|nr:biopolymer transporter ExbD [Chromatiales bacterium]MDP6673496.1 biopolymer transporter ExbD [Gammaproteobacteria bacterium]